MDLTEREREVLDLIARGRTNGEIAEKLGLSFWTAKWYVSEVISKLGVTSREEAADSWRQLNSRAARLGRTLRALVSAHLVARLATAAGGAAMLAGGVVAMSGVRGGYGTEVIPEATATQVTAWATPATPLGPTFLVASLARRDFRKDFYAFETQRGICFDSGSILDTPDGAGGYTRAYLPPVSGNLCPEAQLAEPGHGPVGSLFGMLGPGPGTWVGAGMVSPGVVRLTVVTLGDAIVDIPLIDAPSDLHTDWKFFATFLPDEDGYWNTGHIDAIDGDGRVLDTLDFRPVTRNRPPAPPTPSP